MRDFRCLRMAGGYGSKCVIWPICCYPGGSIILLPMLFRCNPAQTRIHPRIFRGSALILWNLSLASCYAAWGAAPKNWYGGVIPCQVGVLYHAEAEWACGKETMQAQAVVKVLNQRQIFCEIVPVDDLRPGRCKVLFIPKGRLWPRKLFERVKMLRKAGCRIAFVEAWPQGCSDGQCSYFPLDPGV